MFTGLVEEAGVLAARTPRSSSARLVVRCGLGEKSALELGESISVDGVCLTVDAIVNGKAGFEADATSETLARTTLGSLPLGARVNLERAVAVGQRLGGHIVSGHVDGTGKLSARVEMGAGAVKMTFAPVGSHGAELRRFIAEKGSITVNGVSLTVNDVAKDGFSVMLIPHTLQKTSLGALRPGDAVNLEVDVLARYVARLIEVDKEDPNAEWMARLARAGLV
jgi:riboflavin synthase